MSNPFFDHPILNSPYAPPLRHWELDSTGQPTQRVIEERRRASFITPIPKPRQRGAKAQNAQAPLNFADGHGLSTAQQRYDEVSAYINLVRGYVEAWRRLPHPSDWGVTPETARLLQHWRTHPFASYRPFFCQLEAVETAIWLTEVAPHTRNGKEILDYLAAANAEANPSLSRVALKLATGAGKTTVMAMLIAWQTVNAARHPGSPRFTKGFLIVTPGITIKDRLRVLQPNDPDSYYARRELVPEDMLRDLMQARIVITNYHAFRRRDQLELAKGTRTLLQGPTGQPVDTRETEGELVRRVMPELMNLKNILVLNDEAHHCYLTKPGDPDEPDLSADERDEAKANTEAARLWANGLETVGRVIGLQKVFDLSATPFFLRGSGYAEGTLFPWVVTDFSLMDAIECGIVKLPRVPVAQNIPGGEMPIYRNLWEHIRKDMPRKGRGNAGALDPLKLPAKLQTALEALYGHYEKTFELWQQAGVKPPPCFIIVCNNTSVSKLVYDFVSGFHRPDGSFEQGRFGLFRNFEDDGTPLARPRTLLIDSEQLDSGEALDPAFLEAAKDEVDRFRREVVERTGNLQDGERLSPESLLREVMNTVGKEDRLGSGIRCVVSVSMLTEGWDANTVTHVIGVRAFGTQLLCEQVIGRALRRQSYDLNEEGLFNVEYADVLGIPFDFTAKPVVVPPPKVRDVVHVHAIRPDRDPLEIEFPRVEGYRVELPRERLRAAFRPEHGMRLTPEMVGPTVTQNQGIVGAPVDLNLAHLERERLASVAFRLTHHLLNTRWRDPNEEPKLYLFGQMKAIVTRWLETCLECVGGTYPAQLYYLSLAEQACNRINAAIVTEFEGTQPVHAILDPYNPVGSTRFVNFTTSKTNRWETTMSHVNWAILDSDWEGEFCRVADSHPRVRAWVKNQNLGLEVPYLMNGETHTYLPDFIVQVDDGRPDPLNLIVEVKGYRGEDAVVKAMTMNTYWVPGVNNLKTYGRWAFVELTDVWTMQHDLAQKIEGRLRASFEKALDRYTPREGTPA